MHLWLKYSVFLRLKNKEDFKKFLESVSRKLLFFASINPELITFMISAFWHGFYPNYYIFFFFCFILEQTAGLISNKTYYFEYLDEQKKNGGILGQIIYYVVGGLHMNVMNFCGLFFKVLFIDKAFQFTIYMYGIPLILLFAAFAFAKVVPNKKKSKESITRDGNAVIGNKEAANKTD